MTKLSYKIGEIETTNYAEAVEVASRLHRPITRIYTPIEPERKIDHEKVQRRMEAIRRKAAEKAL